MNTRTNPGAPTRAENLTRGVLATTITLAIIWLWLVYDAQCWPDPALGAAVCDTVFPADLATALATGAP